MRPENQLTKPIAADRLIDHKLPGQVTNGAISKAELRLLIAQLPVGSQRELDQLRQIARAGLEEEVLTYISKLHESTPQQRLSIFFQEMRWGSSQPVWD